MMSTKRAKLVSACVEEILKKLGYTTLPDLLAGYFLETLDLI